MSSPPARGFGGREDGYSGSGRAAQGFFRGRLPRFKRLRRMRFRRTAAGHALDVFANDHAAPDVPHVIDHDGRMFGPLFGGRSLQRGGKGICAAAEVAGPAAECGIFGGRVAVAAWGSGLRCASILVPAPVRRSFRLR